MDKHKKDWITKHWKKRQNGEVYKSLYFYEIRINKDFTPTVFNPRNGFQIAFTSKFKSLYEAKSKAYNYISNIIQK